MRPLFALALLAVVSPAAPVPKGMKAKVRDDAALMVGRWIAADPNSHSFAYSDDGTMRVWNGPNEASAVPYRWTLDPTATPKRMTWFDRNSNPPRASFECVYEIDGDELRINYSSTPNVPKGVGADFGSFHRMTRDPATK